MLRVPLVREPNVSVSVRAVGSQLSRDAVVPLPLYVAVPET